MAKTSHQVYGLRFLIGFFEGTTWPAYYTIISQWYLPHEVGLRMSLYNIAQPAGAMLSGATQGALATTLHGAEGRAGWRWAFIINVRSFLCAFSEVLLILRPVRVFAPLQWPSLLSSSSRAMYVVFAFLSRRLVLISSRAQPERPNPLSKFYLKPRHIEIALARARRVSRKPQIGITFKDFCRCFTFWQLWAFGIAWPLAGNTVPSNYFNLWLKSLKNPDGTKTYSVALLNYIPIAGQAVQLVAEVLFSGASDYFRKRLPFLLLHSAINITSLVILIIRPDTRAIHFAGYFLNYVGAYVVTFLLNSPAFSVLSMLTAIKCLHDHSHGMGDREPTARASSTHDALRIRYGLGLCDERFHPHCCLSRSRRAELENRIKVVPWIHHYSNVNFLCYSLPS